MKYSIGSAFIPFLALLLLFPSSCRKEAPKPPEPLVEESKLEPVEAPEYNQALVTFLSGEVTRAAGEDWEYVEIGDFLVAEDALKVGPDSYCELQFGNTAVLRIQADTEIYLKDVFLKPGETKVGVKLAIGSVLAKVSKLSGNEKFQIKSDTAVCGVRGTEFGVQVSEEGTTKVAVKEGKVAVLPASVDVDEIKEKIEGEDQEILVAVEEIEASAPLVEADQEITISTETFKKMEEIFKAVEDAVEKIAEAKAAGKEVFTEEAEELTRLVEETTEKISQAVEPPKEISPESVIELKAIDKMKLVEIPVVPAAAAEAAPAPEEIKLEKYSFNVNPTEAMIYVNGEVVGKGRFSGLFTHGATLTVAFRSERYIEHEMTIPVEKDSGNLYTITLEKVPPPKEKISIRVSPADAEISLDGKSLGKGRFTGEFEVGREIEFVITREGLAPRTLTINVTKGSGRVYEVDLAESVREVLILATPADAEIVLNDEVVGTGSFSGEFPLSQSLSFVIREEGYVERTLTIEVANATGRPYEVVLEEMKRQIALRTSPVDAEIVLDGRVVGTGSFSATYPLSRTLSFQVRSEGYKTQIVIIDVSKAQAAPYVVVLRGEPVPSGAQVPGRAQVTKPEQTFKAGQALKAAQAISKFRVSKAALTGNILVTPERRYVADNSGVLYVLNKQGRTLWSVSTKNTPNVNSSPILIGDNLYLSGADEFVIVNASTGNVITRMDLEKDYSHMFGRRVVSFGQTALFPTNRSIRLINLYTGETRKEIMVPEGSRMTPGVYNSKILIVNQQGELCIINAETEKVEDRIKTGAIQPVAITVSIYNDRAYFADRKGRVVCVDLAEKRVLWERTLRGIKERGIFQDLEVGKHGVFAVSEETLYGYSLLEGDDLFRPIKNVSSPPLYREDQGRLYFGMAANLLLVSDTRGRIFKEVDVGRKVTTRPRFEGGNLIVGTDSGELIVISPDLIE